MLHLHCQEALLALLPLLKVSSSLFYMIQNKKCAYPPNALAGDTGGLKSWPHLLTLRHLQAHTSCQQFQLQLWKLWQPNTLAVANSWTCSATQQSQSSDLGNLQDYFCLQWATWISHLQPRHFVLEIEMLGPKLIYISKLSFVRVEKDQMRITAWTSTNVASTSLETYCNGQPAMTGRREFTAKCFYSFLNRLLWAVTTPASTGRDANCFLTLNFSSSPTIFRTSHLSPTACPILSHSLTWLTDLTKHHQHEHNSTATKRAFIAIF